MEQEVITAIHKAITVTWNPICMGYGTDKDFLNCTFRSIHDACDICLFTHVCGIETYNTWLFHMYMHTFYNYKTPGRIYCPRCAELAEAVLEELVMLLPSEERKVYGG